MSKVILTVGISGSGKTTYARELVQRSPKHVIVCRDDIRASHGLPPMGDSDQEAFVTRVQRGQIEAALLDGLVPIVADTNLNRGIRNGLVKFAHRHGADVEIKTFDVDLETCIERNANRDRKVPEDVIRKQHQKMTHIEETYLPYERFDKVTRKCHLPDAIVVDIDGTVAEHVARSPYDYTRVHTDAPIENVVDIVNRLQGSGVKVLFLSGREDGCKDETEKWLKRFFDFEFSLIMRKAGDVRPDWEIKSELWDEHVIPKYNVIAAFDDRDQVVRHLRARGITVMQVNYGRF